MFILRRACLRHATAGWPPGRFLEIGAGMGRLTTDFLERGFTGMCYDLGTATRDLLRRNLSAFETRIQVIDTLGAATPRSFDYVFAFEVLEHIDEDGEALRSWISFLKPGGRILLSVPAHARKYSDEDRSVGHYRRYEKRLLEHLLQSVECAGVRVLSYGFPIAILTRHGKQLLSRWKRSQPERPPQTPEELSILSGVERSDASLRLAGLVNRHTLAPFIALQRPFYRTDLGDGYVVHAVRLGA